MKYLFITGVNRSGHTTLVSKLNQHNDVAIEDERPFVLPWYWKYSNRVEELKEDFLNYFFPFLFLSLRDHLPMLS